MEGYRLGLYEKAMPDGLSCEEKLLLAKKIGFDYVEISIDETEEKISRLDFDKKRKNELHQFMTEQGIFFETMCCSTHRKYPLGSADTEGSEEKSGYYEKGDCVCQRSWNSCNPACRL